MPPVKLGTLLLRNAAIGLTQLEAALRNQVLYGGRLGTNLVELGYIDLELLSAYLAELSGLPIATPTLLDQADPRLVEQVAEKLGAQVTPYVVPELRALYYLEKLFGLPRRGRFVRAGRAAE